MRRWLVFGALAIAGLILTTGAALAALSLTGPDLTTPAPALGLVNPTEAGRHERPERSEGGRHQPQGGTTSPGAAGDALQGATPHADGGSDDVGNGDDGDHDAEGTDDGDHDADDD